MSERRPRPPALRPGTPCLGSSAFETRHERFSRRGRGTWKRLYFLGSPPDRPIVEKPYRPEWLRLCVSRGPGGPLGSPASSLGDRHGPPVPLVAPALTEAGPFGSRTM